MCTLKWSTGANAVFGSEWDTRRLQEDRVLVKKFLSSLSTVAVIAVCFMVGAALIGTIALRAVGGQINVIETGSMEPTIKPGDVVVDFPVANSAVETRFIRGGTIRTGDVVTFMPNADDPSLITHRVMTMNDDGTFVTKGDANKSPDGQVQRKQVVGKVVASVPKVGYLINSVRTHWYYYVAGVLGLIGLNLIARALGVSSTESKGARSKKTPDDSSTDQTTTNEH